MEATVNPIASSAAGSPILDKLFESGSPCMFICAELAINISP